MTAATGDAGFEAPPRLTNQISEGKLVETFTATTVEGQAVSFSAVRVSSGRSGPTLAVFAAMHGTEYAPVAALGRLIQELDPRRISGTVLLVPTANRLAFETRTMYVCPPDGRNLNRTFPGRADGTYAEVLADLLWRGVASQATALIDVHGGELVEGLVPFTGAYAIETSPALAPVSRQLAEAFKPTYLVLNQVPSEPAPEGSRLAWAATRAGIPAALAEAGSRGRLDEDDILFVFDGVLNAMRLLGMRDEAVDVLSQPPVLLEEIEVYATTSGLFHTRVAPGDSITPGQQLGEIVDYFGATVERFTSEWDGIVLGVIGPAMLPGRFPLVIGTRI